MYYLSIDISDYDIELLNYISKQMFEIQPHYISKEIKDKKYLKLCISSKHIAETLNAYGCVPNKSLVLEFLSDSILPKEFQSDFIRGYFDGDGSISIKKPIEKTGLMITMLGTEKFLKKCKNILNDNNINNISIINDRGYYRLQFTKCEDIYKFYHYIYDDIKSFYYKRKKEKIDNSYEWILSVINKRTSKYKYISYDKSCNTWRIKYKGKYFGRYKTEEEAYDILKGVIHNEEISIC